ncbi:hypothetical protein COOONC_21017 [Cooperia oncophora]
MGVNSSPTLCYFPMRVYLGKHRKISIPNEPLLAQIKPRQLWLVAEHVYHGGIGDDDKRSEMLRHFYCEGYESRRRTIAR